MTLRPPDLVRPRGSLLALGALLFGLASTPSSPSSPLLDAGPSAPASAGSTSPTAAPLASTTESSPSPPIPAPVTIQVSAVGDCTLGGDVRRASELSPFDALIAAHGGDLRYPFSGVRALLESDDVTIANRSVTSCSEAT